MFKILASWISPIWCKFVLFQMWTTQNRGETNTTIDLDALEIATTNLENLIWFGLLEEIDASIKMFNRQFPMPEPLVIGHLRSSAANTLIKTSKTTHLTRVTPQDRSKLASLMPYDIWLYDYAKTIFKSRLKQLSINADFFMKPSRPPFPMLKNNKNEKWKTLNMTLKRSCCYWAYCVECLYVWPVYI